MPDMDEQNGRNGKKAASGEVAPRATRRTFTRAYKLAIVKEAASLRGTGGVGALLRREGLYSSTLVQWRREFEGGGGAAAPLEEKKRGPKPRFTEQEKAVQKLQRENERLRRKLEIAEALVELQKKTFSFLRSPEPGKGDES